MAAESKNESKNKSADRKSGFFGSGAVWLFVLMALAILVVVTLSSTGANVEIAYSDLTTLIKASGPNADGSAKKTDGPGKIRVKVGPPKSEREVEYSGLRDIKIETFRVTGTVVRRFVDRQEDDAQRTSFYTNKSDSDESERHLRSLLEVNGIPHDFAEGPSVWKGYLPMVVVTALFVVVIFLMMRRLGGAGSPMAFGRSRGKMYAQEDLGITFEDVAGIDEAVEELREVVEFLKTPEKYQTLGRPHSQRRAVGRAAGHGKNSTGQSHRRRSGGAVFQPVGLRLRGNVRRRRRRARSRYVPTGRSQGALHHLY